MAKKRAKGESPAQTDLALARAARDGDLAAARNALAEGADPNARDDLGSPALGLAASGGYIDIVQLLLDSGADVSLKDSADMPALTLAARDGQIEVVELLIARGAAGDERVLNDAIFVAQMSQSSHPAVAGLLQNARLQIVAPGTAAADADGRLIQASERGDVDGARAALRAGADVKARDSRGMDALSWAALRGHDAIAKLLLDHGADINALNGAGWPPLGQACGQGKLAVVNTLIARGANVDLVFAGGRTALMCASYQGHVEVVKALLAAGVNKSLSHEGMTARDLAESQGHSQIVELLQG